MATFEALMIAMSVISVSLVLWTYTKSGKKWLKNP